MIRPLSRDTGAQYLRDFAQNWNHVVQSISMVGKNRFESSSDDTSIRNVDIRTKLQDYLNGGATPVDTTLVTIEIVVRKVQRTN